MASTSPSLPTTPTTAAQADLDRTLSSHLASSSSSSSENPNLLLTLDRDAHVAFARRALTTLPSAYSSLGASRPWLLHWAVHSLSLLGAPLSDDASEDSRLRESIVSFLEACQCRERGGFGGGPGQQPHLATTYAAAATLVELGGGRALAACDRRGLARFLLSCIVSGHDDEDGGGYGFRVCPGGEVDVRGCYCALAAAALLRLPPPADARSLAEASGLERYLRDCQTAEGGIGGFPGGPEAHGGYAFCGAAAAAIAASEAERSKKKKKKEKRTTATATKGDDVVDDDENGDDTSFPSLLSSSSSLDLRALLLWASRCQAPTCGGFAGRTNKLVDGCYSWWQGALFGMVTSFGKESSSKNDGDDDDDDDGDVEDDNLSPVSVAAATASFSSSWPAFDPSTLPELPGLPDLPRGTAKAPTAAERARAEAGAAAGAAAAAAAGAATATAPRLAPPSLDAARAAAEEALAASRVREMLPLLSISPKGSEGDEDDDDDNDDDGDDRGDEGKNEKKNHHHRRRRFPKKPPLFDPLGLQMWILAYCQAPSSFSLVEDSDDDEGDEEEEEEEREQGEKHNHRRRRRRRRRKYKGGGLRDKPGKPADHYHTCYCLSGLSSAQGASAAVVVGGEGNRLERTHPLLNVVERKVAEAEAFFASSSSSSSL